MDKNPSIEAIATQFVNLKNDLAVKNFRVQYRAWFPANDQPPHSPGLRTIQRHPQLEKITAGRNAIFERQLLRNIAAWSKQLRGAWGDDRDTAENALAEILDSERCKELRQVKLGSRQMEPRDIFDKIALAILKASERGLLRMCEGHKQGWQCPTPHLVADEKRRVYCYMNCGDEAKSRAKHAWWERNLSARARSNAKRYGKSSLESLT